MDWETWLAEHGPGFLLFARQQTRSESDAQDLVQEAVVECWRREFEAEPPPRALVFATIRRRAVDLARSLERRRIREYASTELGPTNWFDSAVADHERDQLIQNAMNYLPDIYRDVILLKIWGDLTFAEIAQTLEIPANTAASRYRYGLAELRKLTKGVFA